MKVFCSCPFCNTTIGKDEFKSLVRERDQPFEEIMQKFNCPKCEQELIKSYTIEEYVKLWGYREYMELNGY